MHVLGLGGDGIGSVEGAGPGGMAGVKVEAHMGMGMGMGTSAGLDASSAVVAHLDPFSNFDWVGHVPPAGGEGLASATSPAFGQRTHFSHGTSTASGAGPTPARSLRRNCSRTVSSAAMRPTIAGRPTCDEMLELAAFVALRLPLVPSLTGGSCEEGSGQAVLAYMGGWVAVVREGTVRGCLVGMFAVRCGAVRCGAVRCGEVR